MRDGSGLKITIARYYTPNGRNIQAEGIKPDVVVEERFVRETEVDQKHHVQEKDLKNHLSAEPKEETPKKQGSKRKTGRMGGVKLPGEEPSEIVNALLTKDNQAKRALEILTGWQIFSKMAR